MLEEVLELALIHRKLSFYDLANYVVAKCNNGLLATGDEKLKRFAEANCIKVIRTLKIIEWLFENELITKEKMLEALELLINNEKTRIPKEEILKIKNKYAEVIAA